MWPSVRKMVNVGTKMSQVLLKGGFTYLKLIVSLIHFHLEISPFFLLNIECKLSINYMRTPIREVTSSSLKRNLRNARSFFSCDFQNVFDVRKSEQVQELSISRKSF